MRNIAKRIARDLVCGEFQAQELSCCSLSYFLSTSLTRLDSESDGRYGIRFALCMPESLCPGRRQVPQKSHERLFETYSPQSRVREKKHSLPSSNDDVVSELTRDEVEQTSEKFEEHERGLIRRSISDRTYCSVYSEISS